MAYYKPPKITGYMPERYHDDDAQWIFKKINVLDPDLRYKVCRAYDKVFTESFDAEKAPHRKIGKARFAANNRLRLYIVKRFAVFNK